LITLSGTALAASGTENVNSISATNNKGSSPVTPADEAYRRMYEACHGPNGYMTKYFQKNGLDPEDFEGMMNGANSRGMMSGAGYGGMMGF
jgi:hypothetical protein